MTFGEVDLMNLVNRKFILDNSAPDEQMEFIQEQIDDPFDSGSNNYFKRLMKLIYNKDEQDEVCNKILQKIENVYPSLEFDMSEYTEHYASAVSAIYKFFVKSIKSHVFTFLQEYLVFNNRNRKAITSEFISASGAGKVATYPKEQYGKKEYYILVSRLGAIVKRIANDDTIRLVKFLDYIEKSDDTPVHIATIRKLLDDGVICDHGVVGDIFEQFLDSSAKNDILNRLELVITGNLIIPYLKETNALQDRAVFIPDPDLVENSDEDDDDESDDDDEDA